jgi:hypothetical protein
MNAARLLEVASDRPASDPLAKIRAVRLLLVAHVVAETALAWIRSSSLGIPAVPQAALFLASLVALGLALAPRLAWASAPVAAVIVGGAVARYAPDIANHTFLLFLALATLALFPGRDATERILALSTLRWLAAIVLFATGVQKVLHGTYVHGEFLAYQVASGERFATLFRWVLPTEELERLRALAPTSQPLTDTTVLPATLPLGSGPYRFTSPFALLVSNVVYVFEMTAPVLMLVRRTRAVAAVATVVFLAFIEVGAREIMFGILFVNLVLLFLRQNWNGRLLPAFLAAYGYVLAVHLGWLPNWIFS